MPAHSALSASVDTDPYETPHITVSWSSLVDHDSQTVRIKVLAIVQI